MITVSALCDLYCEASNTKIHLWNLCGNQWVFEGGIDDIMRSKYADCVVESIDSPTESGKIVINIWAD